MLTTMLSPADSLTMAQNAEMATKAPDGILLALTSITIVFIVIASLIFAYSLVGKFMTRKKQVANSVKNDGPTEKEIAAITMALDLYLNEEQHDEESYVITIKR